MKQLTLITSALAFCASSALADVPETPLEKCAAEVLSEIYGDQPRAFAVFNRHPDGTTVYLADGVGLLITPVGNKEQFHSRGRVTIKDGVIVGAESHTRHKYIYEDYYGARLVLARKYDKRASPENIEIAKPLADKLKLQIARCTPQTS